MKNQRKTIHPITPSAPGDNTGCTFYALQYNADSCERINNASLLRDPQEHENIWINVLGVQQTTDIKHIFSLYNVHPLLQEDAFSKELRPKVQDYESHVGIILNNPYIEEKAHHIILGQITFIVRKNIVITVQEKQTDVFLSIQQELLSHDTKLRKESADYLASVLIDHVVDNYFVTLEHIAQKLDILENELVNAPTKNTLQTLYRYKKEIMKLVHTIWPLREVISILERNKSDLFSEQTYFHLRNILEYVFQVIDTVTFLRDLTSEMMDIYLSSINNRINDVMKVLTVITTVFMPLSFLAGVYGMNFKHMPELDWGYPGIWIVMVAIFMFMMLYFKRKKWF